MPNPFAVPNVPHLMDQEMALDTGRASSLAPSSLIPPYSGHYGRSVSPAPPPAAPLHMGGALGDAQAATLGSFLHIPVVQQLYRNWQIANHANQSNATVALIAAEENKTLREEIRDLREAVATLQAADSSERKLVCLNRNSTTPPKICIADISYPTVERAVHQGVAATSLAQAIRSPNSHPPQAPNKAPNNHLPWAPNDHLHQACSAASHSILLARRKLSGQRAYPFLFYGIWRTLETTQISRSAHTTNPEYRWRGPFAPDEAK